MTVRISKQNVIDTLKDKVESKSKVNISKCFQCKKCSLGCPASPHAGALPAEIIRRLQLGAGTELLKTDLIWNCLSCDTCTARCPNGIDFASIVDALRALAVDNNIVAPAGNAPLFNKLFLDTVKSYGRTYDLQMIGLHKMKTGNLKQDMDKFPAMLRKGKMALLPPSGANKSTVRRIFKRVDK
jgi:heterodisulfide reductase subunit C2